ncbi:hypothetical protein EK904_010530, partial [Melospiza melodia maxima]
MGEIKSLLVCETKNNYLKINNEYNSGKGNKKRSRVALKHRKDTAQDNVQSAPGNNTARVSLCSVYVDTQNSWERQSVGVQPGNCGASTQPKVLQITLRQAVKAFSLLPARIQLFHIAGLVAVVQTSSRLAGFYTTLFRTYPVEARTLKAMQRDKEGQKVLFPKESSLLSVTALLFNRMYLFCQILCYKHFFQLTEERNSILKIQQWVCESEQIFHLQPFPYSVSEKSFPLEGSGSSPGQPRAKAWMVRGGVGITESPSPLWEQTAARRNSLISELWGWGPEGRNLKLLLL